MPVQIREANAQDAQSLAELLKEIGWFESFKNEPLEVTSQRVRGHVEQCRADKSHSIFVAASSDGKIVGYGSVHWLPYLFLQGPEGYVSELFVRKSARGQGLGRELLRKIEAEARARGCVRLSLINLRNRESYLRQFYVKAGWEERARGCQFRLSDQVNGRFRILGLAEGVCLLIVQFPPQEVSRKAPGRFRQLWIVALAVGHGESVAGAVEEVPIQRLSVGLQTRH
jgi:GNAT superfamily N-acetyltransferase